MRTKNQNEKLGEKLRKLDLVGKARLENARAEILTPKPAEKRVFHSAHPNPVGFFWAITK